MQFFGYLFHYCDLPYANFGLFISLVPKIRISQVAVMKYVNSQKIALAKYLANAKFG